MMTRTALRACAAWVATFAGAAVNLAYSSEPARPYISGAADRQEFATRIELEYFLNAWITATNARDLEKQAVFYPDKMEAFYLWRQVPHAAVLAEKRRVFERAHEVQIRVEEPLIIVEPSGEEARMYFRKSYVIKSLNQGREGEVLQELRWRRSAGKWTIASERDIRVLR